MPRLSGFGHVLTVWAMQDFLKEVDIRFMDQLRRGASIAGTDMARAPQPASLRECYQLMCLTAPEVLLDHLILELMSAALVSCCL